MTADTENKDHAPKPMATPVEILQRRIADEKRRRVPPNIPLPPKPLVHEGKRRRERGYSVLLLGAVIAVALAFAWVGIGALMKKGLLPYVDLGYTWLNNLIARIRA